jgi:hypothetical protein
MAYELDITGLAADDDDLAAAADEALAGETTYLLRDGTRIAAVVPVYVAEEHGEDIDAEITSISAGLVPDFPPDS